MEAIQPADCPNCNDQTAEGLIKVCSKCGHEGCTEFCMVENDPPDYGFRHLNKCPHVYKTFCGGEVLVTSAAKKHLEAHPRVAYYLAEAIGKIVLPIPGTQCLEVSIDMGRVVGTSACVTAPRISPDTLALFAQRTNRDKASHVATKTKGAETSTITLRATRLGKHVFMLETAFFGSPTPREPWDPLITSEAERQIVLDFWCSHALIYDPAIMGPVFESTWHNIINT